MCSVARAPTELRGDVSIFAVRGQPDYRIKRARLTCKHCKKVGHYDTTCYKLHGVPAWWHEKYGGSKHVSDVGELRGGFVAKGKGSGGEPSTDSRGMAGSKDKGQPVLLNAVSGGGDVAVSSSGSGGGTSLNNLTPDQVQFLMNLVNDQKSDRMMGKPFGLSWIVDTGASNHVTGILDCLHDCVAVHNPITLPDGATVVGTKRG